MMIDDDDDDDDDNDDDDVVVRDALWCYRTTLWRHLQLYTTRE